MKSNYRSLRRVIHGRLALAASLVLASASIPLAAQDGPGPGPIGPGPGCNLFPAPPSIGAGVSLSYFGPPPSETNPSLVGPVQLLKSGTVDDQKGTITLPLYQGSVQGKKVWYILTDVNDPNVASFLGINYSAKLQFGANSARTANFDDQGNLIFDRGKVDFSPQRMVVPGPGGFPPQTATPGSVGDADYSPLVRVVNAGGVIYNAPIVAFDVDATQISFPNGGVDYTKVHDQVVAIDPVKGTVTLNLVNGFSFGRPVWYLTMEASTSTAAAIEATTFAPALLRDVLGKDDSFGSPVERLFLAVNGASDGGCNNPQRQGLSGSAHRWPSSQQCVGRHSHHCPRLQPTVGGPALRVDAGRDRPRLSRPADRRIPHPDTGPGWDSDRSRWCEVRYRHVHRQLPDRPTVELRSSHVGRGLRLLAGARWRSPRRLKST